MYEKPISQDKPRRMQAGALSCFYQDGFLRYISYGDKEIVRMIYCALRDRDWQTIPARMTWESITDGKDHFTIRCKLLYEERDIRFETTITIEGSIDNRISYSFHGRALQTFSKNRIGICLHLPLTCQKTPCTLLTTDGQRRSTHFPELISPHQPFRQLKGIEWQVSGQPAASLAFSGDIFEAEDQRNWTDASFKFYSTPLDLPFPVTVEKNTEILQDVTFSLTDSAIPPPRLPKSLIDPIVFTGNGVTHPFPALGFGMPYPYQHITKKQADVLRSMPFTHYRVDLTLNDTWATTWTKALKDQQLLRLPLELVLHFNSYAPLLPPGFPKALKKASAIVSSILLLHVDYQYAPSDFVAAILPMLRSTCPTAQIGAGTDAWFAGWNRHFTPISGLDFTAFPVTPQVHATDTPTLIENLAAQADTIRTARARCGRLNIHVGPVTLKKPHNPNALAITDRQLPYATTTDPRQHTWFAAAWTAVSLRYLSGADSISYFESIGPRGILPAAPRKRWLRRSPHPVSPLSLLLQQIAAFHPERIFETISSQPLQVDGIVLQNRDGSILAILANFAEVRYDVQTAFLPKPYFYKILRSDDDLQTFLQEKWKNAGTFTKKTITVPPYSLTFIANDEPHVRKSAY